MNLNWNTPLIRKLSLALTSVGLLFGSSACSTARSLLAIDPPETKAGPIINPFPAYGAATSGQRDALVVRSRKGDRSLELELPGASADWTDLKIPLAPDFTPGARDSGRETASFGDPSYASRKPSSADREILRELPRPDGEIAGARRDIERDLGLMSSPEDTPQPDQSYLGAIDQVKQLYKVGRFEAALLEVDEMLRLYPTDSKLYEMRGTLLDRLGKSELAMRSWKQALRLEPGNLSLRRVVEKKSVIRSLASPAAPTPAPAVPLPQGGVNP